MVGLLLGTQLNKETRQNIANYFTRGNWFFKISIALPIILFVCNLINSIIDMGTKKITLSEFLGNTSFTIIGCGLFCLIWTMIANINRKKSKRIISGDFMWREGIVTGTEVYGHYNSNTGRSTSIYVTVDGERCYGKRPLPNAGDEAYVIYFNVNEKYAFPKVL